MRQLASIQKIESIEPIEGADFILKATVLGWHLVIRKDENFSTGDLAIYFEIDSLLPDISQFAFLKNPSGKIPEQGFAHRLKTKKLKGVISQGLLLPLSSFPELKKKKCGDDVTNLIGVKKWEPTVGGKNLFSAGEAKNNFPSFIPKTDETRIQSIPEVIDTLQGEKVYVTVKFDGTSATYFFKRFKQKFNRRKFPNGQFGVCSRTVERRKPVPEPLWRTKLVWFASRVKLLKTIRRFGWLRHKNNYLPAGVSLKVNPYWWIEEKYGIENNLRLLGKNIAIQGEICGPSIQKNRLGLKENDLFVFDVYDIDNQRYVDYFEQVNICKTLGLKRVDDVGIFDFNWKSVDEVLEFAKGKYPNGGNREGIVIRTLVTDCEEVKKEADGLWSLTPVRRISFKAVNNDFLLKDED